MWSHACHNTSRCALVGIDQYIVKAGTIADADAMESHPIVTMKYSVSPVVRGDKNSAWHGINDLVRDWEVGHVSALKTTSVHGNSGRLAQIAQ